MNEAEFQELVEAGWRRRLTPEEEAQLQAWLALHPEQQSEWEAETHLNQALDQLSAPAVSSNFTALVLQAARRETEVRRPASRPWWQQAAAWLFPRPATGMAWASLLLCVTWFAWHRTQLQMREQHARDLAVLSSAALLPEPQFLAGDFEALRRLPEEVEDDELLAVLHQTANP